MSSSLASFQSSTQDIITHNIALLISQTEKLKNSCLSESGQIFLHISLSHATTQTSILRYNKKAHHMRRPKKWQILLPSSEATSSFHRRTAWSHAACRYQTHPCHIYRSVHASPLCRACKKICEKICPAQSVIYLVKTSRVMFGNFRFHLSGVQCHFAKNSLRQLNSTLWICDTTSWWVVCRCSAPTIWAHKGSSMWISFLIISHMYAAQPWSRMAGTKNCNQQTLAWIILFHINEIAN